MEFSASPHPLGYIEALPKPTPEDLHEHYANRYFQQNSGSYETSYATDELAYFANGARVAARTADRLELDRSLLDLGCGEGFFAAEFLRTGWSVKCCDYSNYALKRHQPDLLPHFTQGELYASVAQLAEKGETFGLVNLQNVLEHVLDPVDLMLGIKALLKPDRACLRIKVPNDYSAFQQKLLAHGMTKNTWFAPPEHLAYFNKESLGKLLRHCGYEILSLQANFPIELFLTNPNANYCHDRSLGKGAHRARVFCENFLIDSDIDAYIEYSEAAGKLGWGRELIVFARPAASNPTPPGAAT